MKISFFQRSLSMYAHLHSRTIQQEDDTSIVMSAKLPPAVLRPSTSSRMLVVEDSVLELGSLSGVPSTTIMASQLPGPGDLIAFDGEFVTVAFEKSELQANGSRLIRDEGRQALARISLLDGRITDLPESR